MKVTVEKEYSPGILLLKSDIGRKALLYIGNYRTLLKLGDDIEKILGCPVRITIKERYTPHFLYSPVISKRNHKFALKNGRRYYKRCYLTNINARDRTIRIK